MEQVRSEIGIPTCFKYSRGKASLQESRCLSTQPRHASRLRRHDDVLKKTPHLSFVVEVQRCNAPSSRSPGRHVHLPPPLMTLECTFAPHEYPILTGLCTNIIVTACLIRRTTHLTSLCRTLEIPEPAMLHARIAERQCGKAGVLLVVLGLVEEKTWRYRKKAENPGIISSKY